MTKKEQLRSWLYLLLSQVETAKEVDGELVSHPLPGGSGWTLKITLKDETEAAPVEAAVAETVSIKYGFVNKAFLDDALSRLKKSWPQSQMYLWLKEKYGATAYRLVDAVAKLNQQQAAEFVAEVQSRLAKA